MVGVGVVSSVVLALVALDIHQGLRDEAEREIAIQVATEFAIREHDYVVLRTQGLHTIGDQLEKLAEKNIFPSSSPENFDWCASFEGTVDQPTVIVGKCRTNLFGVWEWNSDQPQHLSILESLDVDRFAELAPSTSGL